MAGALLGLKPAIGTVVRLRARIPHADAVEAT
jgi:hypothetical protein